MSLPLEYEKYRRQISFLRRTVEQIQKDFQIFDFDIRFSGDSEAAYDEFFAQIRPIVDGLLNTDPERFMSLLYRIDLDESEMRRAASEHADFLEFICHKILERELQKVVLREHFKNAQNSDGSFDSRISDG